MPYVASIGTYLPCWGSPQRGVAGVDLAQVHHFFTGVDPIGYEDLGFAERYGADKFLEGEETTIGGSLPANRVEAFDAVTILEGPVAHGR